MFIPLVLFTIDAAQDLISWSNFHSLSGQKEDGDEELVCNTDHQLTTFAAFPMISADAFTLVASWFAHTRGTILTRVVLAFIRTL